MYKSHPLFSSSSCLSLEVLLYYDDVEVCNPLGSRAKKHKLGTNTHLMINDSVHVYNQALIVYYLCMLLRLCFFSALFYYMLGNISPKYRSTLRCIQLLAIVKSSILQQYGPDKILEPFMDDIKSLEHVRNYYVIVHVCARLVCVCKLTLCRRME